MAISDLLLARRGAGQGSGFHKTVANLTYTLMTLDLLEAPEATLSNKSCLLCERLRRLLAQLNVHLKLTHIFHPSSYRTLYWRPLCRCHDSHAFLSHNLMILTFPRGRPSWPTGSYWTPGLHWPSWATGTEAGLAIQSLLPSEGQLLED